LVQTLLEYDVGAYIVAKETTVNAHKESSGQHFHFFVQMSDKDYHRYSKRTFKDKFNLRGKALKDKPRQYGRVKKIENPERMAAYTVKDGDIVTNLTEDQLKKFKETSFQAKEQIEMKDKMFSEMKSKFRLLMTQYDIPREPTFREMGVFIIQFIRENAKHPLSKTQIERYVQEYRMYHSKMPAEEIFNLMFPFEN